MKMNNEENDNGGDGDVKWMEERRGEGERGRVERGGRVEREGTGRTSNRH